MTDISSYTPIAKRRAITEYKKYLESDLKVNDHIYCKVNESNIFNFQAMIIGPKDTPYEGGYYFFDITLPTNYPFSCPSVKYYTQGERIRFHPNLYTNGKVCLSILGTWSGPSWTAIMNLSSLLISLQGLLDENPIQNEPGFENVLKSGSRASPYNQLLEYQNINIAVIEMINNPPSLFKLFKTEMFEEFKINYNYFDNYIKENIHKNDTVIYTNIYGLTSKLEFNKLILKIKELKLNLKIDL